MASPRKRLLAAVFALIGVAAVGAAAWFAWGLTKGLGTAGSILAAVTAAMMAGATLFIAWVAVWGPERPASPSGTHRPEQSGVSSTRRESSRRRCVRRDGLG
jgi:hypothetical protein